MNFGHLHCHGEYSILDGYGTAENYAERVKKLGQKYIALTDHGTIDGALRWQEACEEKGVTPIIGCEMYIVKNAILKKKGYSHITLLVKNKTGFRHLNHLLTYANLDGFYYKPRIDYKTLKKYLGGLVILSGCMASLILSDKKAFLEIAKEADNVFLEAMPHNTKKQKKLNKILISINKKYGYPIVATNDCHYIRSKDKEAQEMLMAIQTKAKWADNDRFKFTVSGLYLKSEQEMLKAFRKQKVFNDKQIKEILQNTEKVFGLCRKFRIEKSPPALPYVGSQTTDKEDMAKIEEMCLYGYKKTFGKKLSDNKKYYSRYKIEFDLIGKKKFGRYYLIVKDFLNFCDRSNILYGPGRGSVAGSLIAYLMGITAVDPIKYGLIFERFIAADRIDFPDIDIDIEHNRREEARRYLEERYGSGNVVGITTVQRLQIRGAVKDVARTLDIKADEVNRFTKALGYFFFKEPKESFEVLDDKLKENRHVDENTNEIKMFMKQHPQVIKFARKIEGQVRSQGQHAAGIVLSPTNLTDSARGHLVRRKNNLLLNWDMEEAEKLGFLKLDILALDTLTILGDTQRIVKEKHGQNIDFRKVDVEDRNIFRMINEGRTKGLFQINTNFSTKICEDVKIEEFGNLAASISLSRPGPFESGQTEEYINRKNGSKWKKRHKVYESITKDTYGVIVYQEQVMDAVRKLAGLSYTDADKIRKVIGKKRDKKEFEPFRKAFIKGSLKKKTLTRKQADEFWAMLLKHSRYSFNRAHAVSYATVAMWTGYAKQYYPHEFICAALTYMKEKQEQKNGLIDEAKGLGLSLMLPKLGESKAMAWTIKDNRLYIPFNEVKGIGPKTAEDIVNTANRIKNRPKGFRMVDDTDELKPPPEDSQTKVDKILVEIGAYEPETKIKDTKEIQKYFDFDISRDYAASYPNLFKLYDGDLWPEDIEDALTCKIYSPKIVKKKSYRTLDVIHCQACELRKECRKPVPSSKGKINVAIVCEAPGKDEDKQGEGLVGKAGNKMWSELAKYKLKRKMFHITNVNHCYPSLTRTPDEKQIVACAPFLNEELKKIKCKLALACGNNALFYFTGQKSGIQKMSGQIMWSEVKKMWIVFCVHPSAVLHNSKVNKPLFEKGIKVFAKTLKYQRRKRKSKE